MLPFDVQMQFVTIYNNLKEQKASLEDISEIIRISRNCNSFIAYEEKKLLLKIAKDVLEYCCKIENEMIWSNKQGDFFAGNCVNTLKWKNIFSSYKFNKHNIVLFLEDIICDVKLCSSDFELRNPEVVLRDDVILVNEEDFFKRQIIYYNVLKSVLFY